MKIVIHFSGGKQRRIAILIRGCREIILRLIFGGRINKSAGNVFPEYVVRFQPAHARATVLNLIDKRQSCRRDGIPVSQYNGAR